jgi:hypothetical protein
VVLRLPGRFPAGTTPSNWISCGGSGPSSTCSGNRLARGSRARRNSSPGQGQRMGEGRLQGRRRALPRGRELPYQPPPRKTSQAASQGQREPFQKKQPPRLSPRGAFPCSRPRAATAAGRSTPRAWITVVAAPPSCSPIPIAKRMLLGRSTGTSWKPVACSCFPARRFPPSKWLRHDAVCFYSVRKLWPSDSYQAHILDHYLCGLVSFLLVAVPCRQGSFQTLASVRKP